LLAGLLIAIKTKWSNCIMKEFDPKELAGYNGENGKPIYIVHADKVYDVTGSKLWKGGLHMRRHHAAADLTTDIQAAPHGPEVLERYPLVGVLKKGKAPEAVILPKPIAWLLETNPFFRRHPHPMTVHFPIVFLMAVPVFNILYLLSGIRSFETTALHCLAGGILFSVVAIATGFLTWWYNYMGRMMKQVAIKIPLSLTLLALAIVVFVWRLNVPDVMDNLLGLNIIYFILVLSFFPLVSIVGWYGASLTFPIEKE
jgi:predicted heme/steroid binding protein/uncharacterized membrane protein